MTTIANAIAEVGLGLKAGRTNLVMHIDDDSLKQWQREIFGMIEAAGEGSKDLVENMVSTVLEESRRYVPTDTFTLYNSGYKKIESKLATRVVQGAGATKSYEIVSGTVGYGDNEQAGGPNPRTGIQASSYAWKVHEDVAVKHPNGGQAKFLERAYREYIASELGPELVHLEKCVYQAKHYTPVFRYSARSKTFTGKWQRKRRFEQHSDKVSNLDRLSEIYAATKKG